MYSFANWKNIQVTPLKTRNSIISNSLVLNLEKSALEFSWRLNKQTDRNYIYPSINKNYPNLVFNFDYAKKVNFINYIPISYFSTKFNPEHVKTYAKLKLISKTNPTLNFKSVGVLLLNKYRLHKTRTYKPSILNQTRTLNKNKVYGYISNYRLHYSHRDTFIRVMSNKNYYHSLHWSNNDILKCQLELNFFKEG